MNYKQISSNHINQLALLYIKTYNAPPWNDNWTIELAVQLLDETINCRNSYGLLCVDEEDNIIGAIIGSFETDCRGKQFSIKSFVVDPAYQGRGVGTQILTEFENRLKEQGVVTIYLITNRTYKEEFYNNRGYESWNKIVMMGKNVK